MIRSEESRRAATARERTAGAGETGKGDARSGSPGPEAVRKKELTARLRFVTATNILFLAIIAAGELLPTVVEEDPCNFYLYAVAAGVTFVQLLCCAFVRKRATRNMVVDVTSIILVILLAWLLATAKFDLLPTKMFPAPGEVFAQLVQDRAKIMEGVVSSLSIVIQGFLMGGVAGMALGLVLGFNARTNKATDKVISFFAAIPPIVYIPYGIALLPTFRSCSVMVIFLATFWPAFMGTLAGVNSVDKRAIDSARVLNAPPLTIMGRVVLPAAVPLIFNGLNMGLAVSFILLTSAEMIGGTTGMGYYVKYYSDFGDYTRILAGIIVIGIVITIITVLFSKLQRYLTRWS